MKFDVVTLFPEMIEGACSHSIINRALKENIIEVKTTNPREFSTLKHKRVDDTPYGGGSGMVLMCEPYFKAVESIEKKENYEIILLTPQGEPYNQKICNELSKKDQLILLCGHYEGFDERIRTGIKLSEISLGDFVLTGGELPALCLIDSISRQIEGTLGKIESANEDSFSNGLLEYPHYTKPREFRGMKVPEILLSGDHQKIEKWRYEQQLIRTGSKRPDLMNKKRES